jgi:formate hydrogenlyase subunit 5
LERIHSHLLWLGIAGHIIGFETVLMQAWRIREPIMWLCEQITGNRKTYGMNLIGGVRRDITPEQYPKIMEVVGKIEIQLKELIDAIAGDTTLHLRLKNVGVLTPETAKQLCTVGPTARGSGVAIDSRANHPYAAYSQVPPKVISKPEGDVWARTLVRLEETLESINLVRRALEQMPAGEIMADVKEIRPWREGISYIEAPRGEAIHYVLTGPDNRPYRWRVRAPTYTNLQAIPAMIKGNSIADAPIILGSIDPCFSCTERLEAVDVRTSKVKIYTQKELLEISRKR